jgi:archaellum component FlaC
MSHECNFCKKTFSTKGNLLNHQAKTKFCLEIQGKSLSNLFTCGQCNKHFTSQQNYSNHLCEKNKKIEYEKQKKDEIKILQETLQKRWDEIAVLTEKCRQLSETLQKQQDEIQSLTNHLQKRDEKIEYKDDYIAKLESKLERFENTIVDIAKQPKTTTNTNNSVNHNINNRFDINNTERIGEVLKAHLTKEVIARGQEGVAIMISERLLKGPNGEPLYECTDVSRQKFEFINSDGHVETDPKATKLIRSIGKSGLCEHAKNASNHLWNKPNGQMDLEKYEVFAGNVTEVMQIDKDSTKLRGKLATVTARQRKNSK